MNKVMPEGLSFNESTGELSGTPEGAFDGMLRVIAVLPDGENVEKDISLKIAEKETSGSESTAVSDEPEKTEPSEEVKDPSEETKDPSEETKDPEEKPEEEVPVEKVPSLSPYDERVNFGSLYEGYEEENFELTLFNTGNADAEDLKTEIKGDLADQVTVGELSKIESGGNVTILLSLQPGLKAGKYSSKLIITGADDVRLELPMEVEIQDRNYTISLSQKSLDFGSCSEGYSESGSAKVAVTNTSIFPVTVEKPVSDHFYVSGPDSKTISAGGSESYTVRPVTGLKKGTYEETLVFQSKEGAKASLKVKVEIKEKDEYSFDVYWQNGSGNFGYAPLGYNDENGYAPHSRNLVIRNTGNQTLEFKQPVSHSGNKTVYDITQLDEPTRKAVKPGETITVAIRPVLGLSPDVYDEDIVIDAVNDGRDPVIGAHVTFTVVNESIYRGVDLDQGTVVRENGVSKTAKGLGLPSTVKARTTAGTIDVDVVWNVDSCDYNPALKEEQNFTVWGRIDLPSNVVNYYDYSTMTSIGVRVLAYDPKLANPAENRIYGIAQGDVFQAGKTISFSAEGSGMNRKSAPSRGDIRYEPTYWKVADTNAKWSTEGSWSKSPYSASFAIGSSGSTRDLVFTKEEYDGSQWVSRANDSDGQDVKSVAFKIKGTASVSSAKSDTVTKVKQAVKTGDETELLPMVLLAAAGILVISGTGIMLRNRRKK